jgi:SAM-dependent methyltransferase
MSLLPQNHSEFRTKQYWDEFFQKRENVAFEWYGDYTELAGNVQRSIRPTDRILVIGCGNSNFSSDLYDKGFQNVVNLDFSELVIQEMVEKNTARTKMLWHVGDMTKLNYDDNSFDVVFDKGALDALMSTDTTEVKQKAVDMFTEISRVLRADGKYVCITLAEPYIIDSLLRFYCAAGTTGYTINVDCVMSKKESPFVPFYVEIAKTSSGAVANNSKTVRLHMDEFGQQNPSTASRLSVPCLSCNDAVQQLSQIQAFHQKQFQIAKIEVGRFEKLHFWSDAHAEIPRFTIFMLDHTEARTATLSMAVFMVPVGRESDYQFTTAEGLKDIAAQANCKRLLAVCCNRPHIYPEMKALQEELNPIVLTLKPKSMEASETIPYMAISADTDWEEIATGHSDICGDYVVEESFDDDLPNAVLRRLIFLQNQNFIQTEVRLVQKSGAGNKAGGSKAKKGAKKGGKKKGTKAEGAESFEFDYSYLDAHHCAALSALSLLPSVVNGAHKVPAPNATTGAEGTAPTALLIGLGGGALPMCLQRYLPNLHLYMCDLDGTVDAIAREHFGFKCNSKSHSFVADGLVVVDTLYQQLRGSVVQEASSAVPQTLLASSLLDVLFIDADSKDTTLGISAPPAAFLTLSALIKMHAVLKPGGAVYINIVARSKPLLVELVCKLAAVFGVTQGAANASTAAKGAKDKKKTDLPVSASSAADLARFRADVAVVREELGCAAQEGSFLCYVPFSRGVCASLCVAVHPFTHGGVSPLLILLTYFPISPCVRSLQAPVRAGCITCRRRKRRSMRAFFSSKAPRGRRARRCPVGWRTASTERRCWSSGSR